MSPQEETGMQFTYFTITPARGGRYEITVDGNGRFASRRAARLAAQAWVEKAVANRMEAHGFMTDNWSTHDPRNPTGTVERRITMNRVVSYGETALVHCDVQFLGRTTFIQCIPKQELLAEGEVTIEIAFNLMENTVTLIGEDDVDSEKVTNTSLKLHMEQRK